MTTAHLTLDDLVLEKNGALFYCGKTGTPSRYHPEGTPIRTHRYLLWRVGLHLAHGYDASPRNLGLLAFHMLNPSTADGEKNDNTITRCDAFAWAAGYSRYVVTNFNALIATDPREMVRTQHDHGAAYVRGPENLRWLEQTFKAADMIICAWGSHSVARQLDCTAAWRLLMMHPKKLHALRVSKEGAPAHPLRLPARLRPEPVEPLLVGRVRYVV